MKKFLLGLVLIVVGIASLMLIPSKQLPAPMPWEVNTMADGNIKVFDIHLGSTTYAQAQQLVRQYGKTAIFTQDGSQPSVEAYFDSVNLGGLSAKLVLTLAVDEHVVEALLSQALDARIQDSGAHRYTLENSSQLVNTAVKSLTYIPSIKLNSDMVKHRFGEATSIEKFADMPESELWLYPDLGLSIHLNPNQKTIMQYHQPQ